MREQPNHAVATTPAPKMDWAPVRLVLKDFLSNIDGKVILLLFLVWILKVRLGYEATFWQQSRDLANYHLLYAAAVLLIGFGAIDSYSRDKILWPMLPLGRDHRALIIWLRQVLFPWVTVIVMMLSSMAAVSVICYPKNTASCYTLFCDLITASLFPIVAIGYHGTIRLARERSMIIQALLYFLSLSFTFLVIVVLVRWLFIWNHQAPSMLMVLICLLANIALLYSAYFLRSFMASEHTPSLHPHTDIVPAKMPNKSMPVNSIMGSLRTRFLVSIIVHTLLPLLVVYGCTRIGFAVILLPVWIVTACNPITLMDARELRMLPMSRLYKAWISGWGALAQTALQLLVAIIACNVMRYYRGNFDVPWGGNLLGIVLLTSSMAFLARPLVALFASLRNKNDISMGLSYIFEYIVAFMAIGAICMASVPIKGIPMVPMINDYSQGFMIVSTSIFAAALVSSPHLMKIMWDRESFYRRGPQERQ